MPLGQNETSEIPLWLCLEDSSFQEISLLGLQKLRVLGKLSGFKIHEIKYVRLSKGSLFLFPFIYPMILLRSFLTYYKNIKEDKNLSMNNKKDV